MSLAPKALFVIGPTASGKTAAAHALADAVGRLAAVNLDAFQFYRGVSAGTAKPSAEEIARYSYSLVDFLDPPQRFDARKYASFAREGARVAQQAGRVPLFVGGSGLYLRALLHGLDDLPSADARVREVLRARAAREGWPALHEELRQVDPVRASEIHPNDATRVERAVEVFLLTGQPMSVLRSGRGARRGVAPVEGADRASERASGAVAGLSGGADADADSDTVPVADDRGFRAFVLKVDPDVGWLKERIARRTHELVGDAWFAEVEGLSARYGGDLRRFQCMQAIGYLAILEAVERGVPYPRGELTASITTATWQYARRQRTWNGKEAADVVFDPSRGGALPADALEAVRRFVEGP